MGLRFSRRVTLLPGLRMNLSRSGVSFSAGPRGASVTVGRRGTFLNLGVPGTGVSWRQRIGGSVTGKVLSGRMSGWFLFFLILAAFYFL